MIPIFEFTHFWHCYDGMNDISGLRFKMFRRIHMHFPRIGPIGIPIVVLVISPPDPFLGVSIDWYLHI